MAAESISALEPWVRIGAFAAVFVLVAGWEVVTPRRTSRFNRRQRWPHNLALLALDTAVVRLVAPGAAVAFAVAANAQGWGLVQVLDLPSWAAVVLGFVALDLTIYLQHVVFHRVPMLWRLHRVHHADPDFDVTTGTRFHPVEILLSLGVKCTAIAAFGAPPLAVVIFEVTLNAAAMFNHANAKLAERADRWLRWIVVTPDMHRVHHSVVAGEMNSNFGFNLAVWDRLFGTYRAQPAAGHAPMRIGIEGLNAAEELTLARLLTQPLREPADPHAFLRKEHA